MKRNIIVITIVGLIVLYAYLSEKFSNRNKIDLSNYELNQNLSKKLESDMRKSLFPNVDSLNVKIYELKSTPYEKYIIAYIDVNRNLFFNDSLFNSNYNVPFVDVVTLIIKEGHIVTDTKFHYKEVSKEINRDVHLDFKCPLK
ncbi:MAG: hypothetical protein ABI723_01215 [Bacteroidia bacterium]